MILIDVPTITDWLSAVAALIGAPLAIWGFVKLVLKDKERESQLNSLASMAQQLTDQVQQLATQTSEFKYQSTLMYEQNKLIEKQLQLQTDAYMQSKDLEEKKQAFEKEKRRNDIKPHFLFTHGGRFGDKVDLSLKNKGGKAENITIEFNGPDFLTLSTYYKEVEHNQDFTINMFLPNSNPYQYPNSIIYYDLNLNFTDIDGNKYYQNFKFQNHNHYFGTPVLIE